MKKPWAKALGPQNTYAVVTILALLFTLPLVAVFDVKDMAAVYQQVRHYGVGCCLCVSVLVVYICIPGDRFECVCENEKARRTRARKTDRLRLPVCYVHVAVQRTLAVLLRVPLYSLCRFTTFSCLMQPCVTQVQAMGTGMDVLKYSALSGLTFYLYNEASFQVP
jgi:hypothetical protein